MSKLIRAVGARYSKLPILWYAFSVGVLLSFCAGLKIGSEAILDDFCLLFPSIICPVLIAVSIGSEYNGGAIRNKIVFGYKREQIFISEFVFAFIIFNCLFLLSSLPVLFLNWRNLVQLLSAEILAKSFIVFYLLSLVVSAVSVTISCLSANRVFSYIIMLVSIVLLLVLGFLLSDKLARPEFIYIYNSNEVVLTENPYYFGGVKGTVLRFLHKCNPFGQMVDSFNMLSTHINSNGVVTSFSDNDVAQLNVAPFYSIGVILISLVSGVLSFRKKSLK